MQHDQVLKTDGAQVSVRVRGAGVHCVCPFVCPHPLMMRRHLDVHDKSEPGRSAQSCRRRKKSTLR